MVTVAKNGETGEIGLFGVDEMARGRGIGSSLLASALNWFSDRDCERATVATQSQNKPAMAVYSKAGFRLEAVADVYHFWT